MRPIHPFPARMAPDTVAQCLKALPSSSRVLDPMCGSGVVIRQSALLGHKAQGFDVDPLAVLMSKVWTRKCSHQSLNGLAHSLVVQAKRRRRCSILQLPWVAACQETRAFIEYWFAEPQRSALVAIVLEIECTQGMHEDWVCDALRLALSKIIVTKQAGASLAWDVSHSRPHRVRETNDFDVFNGFYRAVSRLVETLDAESLPRSGSVKLGDCRNLSSIRTGLVDAVVTSPPYLNAIDYLRGHKLALVWMGYTIPHLRRIRAGAIGTERAADAAASLAIGTIESVVRSIRNLPRRQRAIVQKYTQDAALMLHEMRRVLSSDGILVLVLGDSNLRGVPVHNSRIFRHIAEMNGFDLTKEHKRPFLENRRYLPISNTSGALAKRMKYEVLQTYRPSSRA